jgi:hypothetical protein
MQEIEQAPQFAGLEVKKSDQVVIVGPKRSGKSNFTAWFVEDRPSVVVIDSKRLPEEWQAFGERRGWAVTKEPTDLARFPRVIFQPNERDLRDTRKNWEDPEHPWTKALTLIFQRGNTVVVFDETVQTLPSGRSHPTAVQIYTQGGGFGLLVIAGTQFANRIDTMTTRMADHCFAFRLLHKDAQLITEARSLPCPELPGLAQYEFVYHRSASTEWVRCQPVELVEGWGS